MSKFAKELEGDDSEDEDAVVIGAEDVAQTSQPSLNPIQNKGNDGIPLSEAEKELLREELLKTEDEISTLKQVLVARQKHAGELKRKLGLSPFSELSQDINRSVKVVTDTEAFQKTAEVTAAAADTVKEKWQDMRNSSLFKSFESKLGTAYNQAKMAASTSIDHLAGAARGQSQAGTPVAEEAKPMP
ncbi:unnamed protein product [Caenorhabditis auriculariae]|uniref:Tumor protein D52 n=1 Tax=Caenorhabditis auriculariae TaxID=2777116 RepID=A0A8S1H010_9PELO|nr:unnamed protein product [Caenorhabditis auriculariae]